MTMWNLMIFNRRIFSKNSSLPGIKAMKLRFFQYRMGSEQVKVCGVSIVAPATPTVKHHRMFLSTLDLRSAIYNNMSFVLFYKASRETEFGFIVENLKRSLSLALVDFYPFAGRLDLKGEESGRPEVDCNDEGVDFVEASIDIALHDDVELNDFQNKDFFKELVPTWNQSYEAPLLSVQVTAFLGGGFCIGVRFHHVVADAMSFWHFMESWAELSRGIPISKKPHHMMTTVFKRDTIPGTILFTTKQVLTDLSKEAYISCFTRHDNLLPTSKYSGSTSNAVSEENNIQRSLKEETKLQVSTFHFSDKLIKNLKERSGALSSFVAVAAQFWRCVIKAREVGEEENVDIEVVAECRGRVKPPLPATYFGNCVSSGYARTTAKELLQQDIRFAARLIQETIKSCTTQEYINNQIELYESEFSSRGQISTEFLSGSRYIVNTMMSPKFAVYEIDHGWGSPLSVQDAFMVSSTLIGGLYFFAGRGGGITVSTQLPLHQMETLRQILMIIPD